MIDTQNLEEKISSSGKTKTHLAAQMGITLQTFRLKATNKFDFTTREVSILCDELGINKLSEKEKIFFAK
jgi:hypothetical protein